MPIFLNTNQYIAGTVANIGNTANESVLLSEDRTVGSTSSFVVWGTGSGQRVTIAGTAVSATSAVIVLNGEENRVGVLSSGQVHSMGIEDQAAISIWGTNSLVSNAGEISGATGVFFSTSGGGGQQLVNHGLITGHGFGAPDNGFNPQPYGVGVRIDAGVYEYAEPDGIRVSIVNTGIISGARLDDNAPGYSILQTANEEDLENYITTPVDTTNAPVTVINSGQLMGHVRLLDQGNRIENSGLIHGNVQTGNGNDRLDSREGRMTGIVEMGNGDDTVYGSAYGDDLRGQGGNDRMFGMDGNDVLNGGSGDDTIFGGAGDDTIDGDAGADVLHGGSGNDWIDGGSGFDLIYGGPGEDTIYGGTADDTVYGGSGDDLVYGGANADLVYGGSGDDELHGDSGFDTLYGGSGNDTLYGGTANDSLFGGSGDDLLFGGSGNDTLRGETGNDTLYGDSGNNLMYGGSGDDVLHAGTGTDVMYGGWGEDVFVWRSVAHSPHGPDRDTVMDFTPGEDRIDLSQIMSGLTFIGGAAYSNTAGEVRYNDAIGRLYIDTTGNGGSNFSIDLDGAPALTGADLIL